MPPLLARLLDRVVVGRLRVTGPPVLRTPGVRGAAASACSREQIGQLAAKRLWRQNEGTELALILGVRAPWARSGSRGARR